MDHMELYFPSCLLESDVVKTENFSFWKQYTLTETGLVIYEVSVIPRSDSIYLKHDPLDLSRCRCDAVIMIQPYNSPGLVPYKMPIKFHSQNKDKSSEHVCVCELNDETDERMKEKVEIILKSAMSSTIKKL